MADKLINSYIACNFDSSVDVYEATYKGWTQAGCMQCPTSACWLEVSISAAGCGGCWVSGYGADIGATGGVAGTYTFYQDLDQFVGLVPSSATVYVCDGGSGSSSPDEVYVNISCYYDPLFGYAWGGQIRTGVDYIDDDTGEPAHAEGDLFNGVVFTGFDPIDSVTIPGSGCQDDEGSLSAIIGSGSISINIIRCSL